ncbi:MAG TPA: hypothetical protein PLE99_06980 [Candidatus Thiothrix moscowensis]|uniref:hypothetical protein n=1 Tax=unclassified Thiothrix TaxID=2636184 RepID=UPI0026015F0C|nr:MULTISPECIES: hypothetical protein [unclassified Thiothrix]HRJ52492.1 hypothetical protein [Candidatus Thiothrix moscowensis]HRJ93322.1 hypothetical protein [Candidatus Thiothrix moscowensis]
MSATFDFILSIPVADRPAHLRHCLESIQQQRALYGYPGNITVVVAEDSREPRHIAAHKALVAEYRAQGLAVIHFDLPEQYRVLQSIPESQRQQLGRLLTTQPAEHFYRKGQAANRNLSYLKMLELTEDKTRTLYYLVDSDQLFLPELDYFHTINRIFQTTNTTMLTGKLVGDPPVSPAVMAANFLDDVGAFLHEIGGYAGQGECQFHRDTPLPGDAAYHDMAPLFGLGQQVDHFAYRCPLHGEHDHAACLAHFAVRLSAFFSGEHLTRKTAFQPAADVLQLSPARTVYPGNYIVNFDGLKYIIPFGHLRLRMSGPTAGRLIQAEIGARFASANLPMLHKRTTDEDDGFRPGVEQQHDAAIDISDEFERQFFGDLMLFSVVEWLKTYHLDQLSDTDLLTQVLAKVEAELLTLYASKHAAVNARRLELEQWVQQPHHWWHGTPAMQQVLQFLGNIGRNFSDQSPAWGQIQSVAHRQQRKQQILDALMNYRAERAVWDQLFAW